MRVVDSPPTIEELTEKITVVKEGKVSHLFLFVCLFVCFYTQDTYTLFAFIEKMKSVEWLVKQISLYMHCSELCSFYLEKLYVACSPSSLNGIIKKSISSMIKLIS